ncbi:ABC transporter permease [Natronomonas sp. F2-12]|uniref:ABC transporter permease n=1 Tax=Natronomonas aquatica TaxID=2841590 RepID=A0A9R1CQQ9_9EURY|nr:ABC transporter permease [Natronomonas aquatica]MCQ4332127.1 ABC transporter permease [Natronomonas aquatica]
MATEKTDKPDRFDEVDWTELAGTRRRDLSVNSLGMIATTLPLVALFAYDWRFVGEREATFGAVGLEADWSGIDFMFVFTLLLFCFYLVLPLYQHPRMTRYYWREFKRNRPAVVSLGWLLVVFVGGLLGPLVLNAPQQDVLAGHQPPVFLSIDAANVAQCLGEVRGGRCYGTWQYPLGTTRGGKGVFRTIVYGMTISTQIAFITTTIVAAIGVSVGTASAYAGGWVDELLMRFVDIVLSFPTLLMFLLILYIYGAGLGMFIFVFSLFAWGGTARYVRSKSLSVAEAAYIDASRLSGAGTYRVVRRHVVPNTASSIITQLTLLVPGFLLAEAQLAFLELGDSELPSWGQLISAGRSDLAFAPWIVLAPGIVLFLTILAFNFLGDALLDALDPQTEAETER